MTASSNTTTTTPASDQTRLTTGELASLASKIKHWGTSLGFDAVGIADLDLATHESRLNAWIDKGMHGDMDYMHKHGSKRSRPSELIPGTRRVISVRMDYAPDDIKQAETILEQQDIAYISRYALGRDYHKVLRGRLKKLAQLINAEIGEFGYRVFTDSAPVLEKALAEKAGLGWIGKHSNLLDSQTGSWFFLGELYVDLELPIDESATNHCGSCTKCIDVCPTQAIIGPYQVDARLCISYLTIELKDSIPVELRSKMGNRIYGCDDCQFVCPWNKFAQTSKEPDFTPREQLSDRKLLDLFRWSEEDFLKNTEGTAIRRIGYQSWLRNIAVALGNTQAKMKHQGDSFTKETTSNSTTLTTNSITLLNEVIAGLKEKRATSSPMVLEHIDWALQQLAD